MASLERRIEAVEDALALLRLEYGVWFYPGNEGDLGTLYAISDSSNYNEIAVIRTFQHGKVHD